MSTLLIIVAVVIVIITVTLNIGLNVKYDLLKNIGNIKISVFGITVFKIDVSLIAGYFNLIRKNKKIIQIKINIDEDSFKFVNDISNNFKQKIYLSKIEFKALVCSKSAKNISELAGLLYVITGVVGSKIKANNSETMIENKINIGYLNEQLKIGIKANVLICLFDIIWAISKAITQRRVYEKARKFGRKC